MELAIFLVLLLAIVAFAARGVTPSTVLSNTKDAEARYLDALAEMPGDGAGIFEGIVDFEFDADDGTLEYSMLSGLPQLTELKDELKPSGVDAKKLSVDTKVYKGGVEVPRRTLERTDAATGSGFTRFIEQLTDDVVPAREQDLTDLLTSPGNDILGSTFFGTSVSLFNSDGSVTNDHTQTGTTPWEILTDIETVLQEAAKNKGTRNRPWVGPAALQGRKIVMVSPDRWGDAFRALEQDITLDIATQTAGVTNVHVRSFELRMNPYYTGNTIFVIFAGLRFKPLVGAIAAQPEFESNVRAALQGRDSNLIKTEKYLFATREERAQTYGLRYAIHRIS